MTEDGKRMNTDSPFWLGKQVLGCIGIVLLILIGGCVLIMAIGSAGLQ